MSDLFQSTSKTVALSSGNIHYHEKGEGQVLLLIHGSGPGVRGWANFQGILEHFAKAFRCFIIDLPGYGDSAPREGNPVMEGVTACVEFLDALSIDRAHILGNSLGGMVGSYIAAQHPDRVISFTTIGGIGLNLFSSFPPEGVNLLSAFANDPSRERITDWLHSMVYDKSIITDELIESRLQQAMEPNTLASTKAIYSTAALEAIAKMRRENPAGVIGHLSAIQAPTLLTWGRDDRVTPVDGSLIPMRIIPNCELHVFPNCGHWPMIESKTEFETVVMAFLKRY